MTYPQAIALAVFLGLLRTDYVEASEPMETERSWHVPPDVRAALHLDYEVPKLPPQVPEPLPPNMMYMAPIYNAWDQHERAFPMEASMRRSSSLLGS